jgi:hypothetical protein
MHDPLSGLLSYERGRSWDHPGDLHVGALPRVHHHSVGTLEGVQLAELF